MKKIINGKVYDTATSELVAEWDNGKRADNLNVVCEDLYRKRTGEYFLDGYGGPMTKYAVHIGDTNYSGGESIIPLSINAAMRWAEEHLSAEEYEKIFGEIQEDDTKQVVSLSVTASNYQRAKRAAEIKGISVSALVDGLMGQL